MAEGRAIERGIGAWKRGRKMCASRVVQCEQSGAAQGHSVSEVVQEQGRAGCPQGAEGHWRSAMKPMAMKLSMA